MADFVIIDCPPMLIADALYLAAKVDGVVVVIRPGTVRKKAALDMLEQFERTGVRVLGVVLNRIPLTGLDSYGSYSYYSSYYSDEESSEKKSPSKLHEYLNTHKKKAQAGIENLRNRKADQ
jgi:Mrp family chromosome partitioning ATPase